MIVVSKWNTRSSEIDGSGGAVETAIHCASGDPIQHIEWLQILHLCWRDQIT